MISLLSLIANPTNVQEEVIALLLEAKAKHPEAKCFLIDGFPANVDQAKICEEKIGIPR